MRPLLLALLLFAQTLLAQSHYQVLQLKVDSIMEKHKIFGAQFVLVSKDSVLWKHNFGVADIETNEPVTDRTMFPIASITKSFIALSVMMLVEQGKLSLEDRPKELIPEVPFTNPWEETNPVKLVHLLEHTTGFDDMHLIEIAANGEGWNTLQGLQFHADSKTSRWPPGNYMSYCNSGPGIAAYMLEKTTSTTIENFVKLNIFDPLAMEHSSFYKTDYVAKNISKGYTRKKKEAPYRHHIHRAAGAINSTASEMASYLQLYLNRGTKDSLQYVKPTSIDRMEHPETTLTGKMGIDEGYGLYINNRPYKGTKVCGHSGGVEGFQTQMNYLPELGLGYFFAINTNSVHFRDINETILNFLIDPDGTWSKPKIKTAGFDPAVLGYYRMANSRSQARRYLGWLVNILKIEQNEDTLYSKGLFEPSNQISVLGNKVFLQYKKNGRSTHMVLINDDKEGNLLQETSTGTTYYKSNAIAVWGGLIGAALSIALMTLSVLAAVVWIPIAFFRNKQIRFLRGLVLPLLGSLSLLGFIAFLIVPQIKGNSLEALSNPTPWSIGIFICSMLLPLFAILGLVTSFQSLNRPMHNALRIFSIFVSLGVLFIAIYFAYWGNIGLRTWAH